MMVRPLRFAIISDPHIARPHTIAPTPQRFHLVEVSIPAMEQILRSLETQALDFLLLPGDLTQHGERENHDWLVNRLRQLPFPAYVVPGNHDIITRDGSDRTIGLAEFPPLYRDFGYSGDRPYYHQELAPGAHLIGLNSIAFDDEGQQLFSGFVDGAQLDWLTQMLEKLRSEWVMVAIHHNVLEHLPGQSRHPMGRRYITKKSRRTDAPTAAGGRQAPVHGASACAGYRPSRRPLGNHDGLSGQLSPPLSNFDPHAPTDWGHAARDREPARSSSARLARLANHLAPVDARSLPAFHGQVSHQSAVQPAGGEGGIFMPPSCKTFGQRFPLGMVCLTMLTCPLSSIACSKPLGRWMPPGGIAPSITRPPCGFPLPMLS